LAPVEQGRHPVALFLQVVILFFLLSLLLEVVEQVFIQTNQALLVDQVEEEAREPDLVSLVDLEPLIKATLEEPVMQVAVALVVARARPGQTVLVRAVA